MTTQQAAKKSTERGRKTRAQETREANPVHEPPIDFGESNLLPNIPARPGYAQRWIRAKKGSEADSHNLYAAASRGWVARDPGTVPKHMQWLTVQREGMGGCIGTHDMVLMERPLELNKQEADIKRRDRREREQAVRNSLFSEYKNLGGSGTGFTAPDVDSKARTERGRPPEVDDD